MPKAKIFFLVELAAGTVKEFKLEQYNFGTEIKEMGHGKKKSKLENIQTKYLNPRKCPQ